MLLYLLATSLAVLLLNFIPFRAHADKGIKPLTFLGIILAFLCGCWRVVAPCFQGGQKESLVFSINTCFWNFSHQLHILILLIGCFCLCSNLSSAQSNSSEKTTKRLINLHFLLMLSQSFALSTSQYSEISIWMIIFNATLIAVHCIQKECPSGTHEDLLNRVHEYGSMIIPQAIFIELLLQVFTVVADQAGVSPATPGPTMDSFQPSIQAHLKYHLNDCLHLVLGGYTLTCFHSLRGKSGTDGHAPSFIPRLIQSLAALISMKLDGNVNRQLSWILLFVGVAYLIGTNALGV